jgi:hypothetical protein
MPREWFIAKIKEFGFVKHPLDLHGKAGRLEIYRRGHKDMIFVPDLDHLPEVWVRETLRLKAGLSEAEISRFLTFH